MKLLYLEARKGMLCRSVLIALALFLCLNTLKIYMDYRGGEIREVAANNSDMQTAYTQIYRHARGTITSETASFISSEYQRLTALTADGTYSRELQEGTYSGYLFGDFYLFHKYFYQAMSYSVKYPFLMDAVLEQAENNLTLYRECGNTGDAVKSTYILNHYTGRSIPIFYQYDGWESLLSYDFSDLLILLLLVLGVAPIFTREKETGMTLILYSSKRGRWTLLFSKCGTIVCFVCVLTTLFSLANVLTFGVLCGFEGGASPLYAIETYQNTPFSGTILSFYVLSASMKAIGFSVTAFLLSLLSAYFQKTLYPCLVGLGIGVVLAFFAGWAVSPVWWKSALSACSPLTLTRIWEMQSGLYGMSIGNLYLLRIYIILAVQIILAAALVFLIGRKSCCKSN